MQPLLARSVAVLAVPLLALFTPSARANPAAGVSDERVSLPEAPGALGGVGENATSSGNQGALTYRVPIEVPGGFEGLTPEVGLSYSSSAGTGLLGIGWSLPAFSIERMTSKGLQRYGRDDRFVAEQSEELVRVGEDGTRATYRARFEGSFIRYTWEERGSGAGGYWVAEYPDGRKGYFGASETGVADTAAQVVVPGTGNVFRWHLVALVDPWGHAMRFNWTKGAGGYPLLERIEYLYEGSTPRHSVRFTYEARPDVQSDARPGFELSLTQRLKVLGLFSGEEMVRAYAFAYEAEADSGGASRLSSISRFGRGNVLHPVRFSFGYSRTLGGACEAGCDRPFVRSMGTLGGVDFSTGRATLLDINGDALPDVLASDTQGRHTFFYAQLDGEGQVSFQQATRASTKTTGGSAFVLGDARVQVLDVNGDGFVDITQAKLPAVLCNDGSGDWTDASYCAPQAAPGLPASFTPEEDGDAAQADPRYVRFFDYDNDKRIDWLRTLAGGSGTQVLANTPAGFEPVSVDNIGAVFDEGPLQLADMNGDGLQDPVQLVTSGAAVQVQYRLNLGYGRWSPDWKVVTLSGMEPSQAFLAELQDINGDGLADVVAVSGTQVSLALNRSGDHFDAVLTLDSDDLGAGSIPARVATTTVAYADMNGNGSDDVVWIQANGDVSYLELFPVRPNLISRIENGIGSVQLITYGTSIAEQARDVAAGEAWSYRLPNPMSVVKRMDTYATLTGSDSGGLRESTVFTYHSGYYDGVEKQFRGYETVERALLGSAQDAQEPGLFVLEFDIGRTNPVFAGLQRRQTVYAGEAHALLREDRSSWEVCPVAQVPEGTSPAVSFACETRTDTVLVERDPSNAVTTRLERTWDGYGNVTREANLGVVNLGTPEGPSACAPCTASGVFGQACGDTCSGDEFFVETDFVVPGADTSGAWLTGLVRREASGAVPGALDAEALTFYDGADFEGLPSGRATRGFVSRVSRRSGPNAQDLLAVERLAADAHGNVRESIEPNGSPSDASSHRRLYTYDATGLHATAVEVRIGGVAGAASALRRDMVYEPSFEQVAQASSWYPVVGGNPAATAQLSRYRYDEHGRLARLLEPGDTEASASQELRYELGNPASRVLLLRRSSATSGQDLVEARCFDGRGRLFQTRTQLSDGAWQVSGFVEFDARGAVVRRFQPYVATTGACEQTAPTEVAFTRYTYDALGRMLSEAESDGASRRVVYGPLRTRHFDEEDSSTGAPFANTPTVEERDGLGRLVALHRLFAPEGTGTPATTRYAYDRLGHMAVIRDAAGNVQTQSFDILGRLVRLAGTNSGETAYEYDASGNEVRRTDARGKVVRSAYDGADRLVAQWDEAQEAATRTEWRYDLLPGCTECTNAGGFPVEVRWPGAGTTDSDRYGYDATGNHVFTERSIGGHAFVTRRTYDRADREVATVYPGGLTLGRTYDGYGRPLAIDGVIDAVGYETRGELASITFSNGVRTSYGYDARRRVESLTTLSKDGTPLLDLRFQYGAQGNLLGVTDGDRPGRTRHAARFGFDAWDRMNRAELDRAGGETEVVTLTFDVIDNVTSQTSSLGGRSRVNLGDYTYDAARPNAVTRAGSLDYSYDAAGALVGRGDVTLERDHLGRIVRAERGGVESGRFVYAGPERVIREEAEGGTTWWLGEDYELRDGISVLYARLGQARVARLQSDALAATVLSDIAPASGSGTTLSPQGDTVIDVADAWLAKAAEKGVVQLSGGPTPSSVQALLRSSARRLLMEDVVWLHQDHLASTVAATDTNGALRAEQSFYPTGEVRERTGYVDTHGFTGQEQDVSTGLVHFRYRELEPLTGRWDRVDPAFALLDEDIASYLGQSTGGYAYVGNAFVNANDPTGLFVSAGGAARTAVATYKGTKWLAKKAVSGAKATGSKAAAAGRWTKGKASAAGGWARGKAVSGAGWAKGKAVSAGAWAKDKGKAGLAAAKAEVKNNPKASLATAISTVLSMTSAALSFGATFTEMDSETVGDAQDGTATDLRLASSVIGGVGTAISVGTVIAKAASSSSEPPNPAKAANTQGPAAADTNNTAAPARGPQMASHRGRNNNN